MIMMIKLMTMKMAIGGSFEVSRSSVGGSPAKTEAGAFEKNASLVLTSATYATYLTYVTNMSFFLIPGDSQALPSWCL